MWAKLRTLVSSHLLSFWVSSLNISLQVFVPSWSCISLSFFFFCHSSKTEVVWCSTDGCVQIIKTLEIILCISETSTMTIRRIMQRVWNMLLSQGLYEPNQLKLNRSKNEPDKESTYFSQIPYNYVPIIPDVFICVPQEVSEQISPCPVSR
jgi:hypothetical protein